MSRARASARAGLPRRLERIWTVDSINTIQVCDEQYMSLDLPDPTTTKYVKVGKYQFKYFVHVRDQTVHLTHIPEEVVAMPADTRDAFIRMAVRAAYKNKNEAPAPSAERVAAEAEAAAKIRAANPAAAARAAAAAAAAAELSGTQSASEDGLKPGARSWTYRC